MTLSRVCKQYIDLEKADWYASDSRIVVASVQTLKKKRLERFRADTFSLIICDEFHHGAADSYRAIFDYFADAKIIGLTATPKRADGVGLYNVSDAHCRPFGVTEGLEWGSFVPILPRAEYIDEIDLSKVKAQAGDLSLSELEEQIARAAAPIAKYAIKHMEDRPTIIYTPGVASAHAVAATLREKGKTAAAIDAKTDEITRQRIYEQFAKNQLQFIANCMILTEGWDAPNCRGVVMARPTKSEGLYCQAAMRGGRPLGHVGYLKTAGERREAIAASAKPNFILLDITGNAGKHSLVTASDVLGGDPLPDKVKKKVSELDSIYDEDLLKKIDRAKKMVEEEEQEEIVNQRRIAQIAAQAEIKSREASFDPFKKLGFDERLHGMEVENPEAPATTSDLEWLKKNRLPFKNATRGYTEKLRMQARKWAKEGTGTWSMRKILSSFGLPVDLPFGQAGEIIGYIKTCGYRPDKRKLDDMVRGNSAKTKDNDNWGEIPF